MPDAGPTRCDDARTRRFVLPAIFVLGISCVTTQLVLLRELLCAFAGNELVLGVVLGNWLFLMGAGAWLGRRAKRLGDPIGCFLWTEILIALLPMMEVFAVRVLRNEIFTRGATIGIHATVISSFVVLLPYCLAAGFLLTLACAICAKAGDAEGSAGRVYVADSVGSILGGALFSLLLVRVLDPFALLGMVGSLMLGIAALLAWRAQRRSLLAVSVLAVTCLVSVMMLLQPDLASAKLQYPGANILFRGNSPYGQLVVTGADHQINFFQNGLPVLSTHNTEQVEETVHYAMAQRPEARRVLLVGGGAAGTARELLKYGAAITYVELDPLFLRLGHRFLPENLADTRIHVVNTDGRRFVQTTREHFDVIIVDLADPATAQLNRFHTAEFFGEVQHALTPHGVLGLAVGRYENFISPELARVLATAHRTLRCVFTNVMMLPGGRVFFLASDGALDTDIADRLERARIHTRFVNRHYLDATLMPDRLADLQRAVARDTTVNRDFSPVLYFHCLRHWASQFNRGFGIIGIVAALIVAAYMVRLRSGAAALFASGFAAASLEVVLLLGFQALCGSLYYQLGIIVTVFMAGLAVGAVWANRSVQNHGRRLLAALALAIALFALMLPFTLMCLSRAPELRASTLGIQITINLMTFVLAGLVGAQFPVANRVDYAHSAATASRLYTADFVGASLGALFASAWLIPTLGVMKMCWIAAGLNLLGAAAVWLERPRPA